jgi:hypothetical protein
LGWEGEEGGDVWDIDADRDTVVFAIYADSFLFVFATAVLQFGFGVNQSIYICQSAILLCLVCYVTTKVCFGWSGGGMVDVGCLDVG